MISHSLALSLRDAGLVWKPATGDRFVITQPEMAGEVFVLSDMTVEVQSLPQGDVIGFNGTTEWALDSVEDSHALWLPREGQLRELLGGTFTSLTRSGTAGAPPGAPGAATTWTVRIELDGAALSFSADDVEDAYAQALFTLVTRATS